jgi:hypothetical protein
MLVIRITAEITEPVMTPRRGESPAAAQALPDGLDDDLAGEGVRTHGGAGLLTTGTQAIAARPSSSTLAVQKYDGGVTMLAQPVKSRTSSPAIGQPSAWRTT